MLVDTHCHLNFKAFNSDWREVAQRAFDAGVKGIINVGSNYDTSVRVVELARQYYGGKIDDGKLYAAVGLHPIHVADEDFSIGAYKELAQDPTVVAIGETGLDLFHNPHTLDRQKDVLIEYLALASELNKPVIIHNRQAGAEVLEVINAVNNLPRGVMHFFSEDWAYAQKLLELGFYLSFTGAITLGSIGADTIEVIKKVPLDRVMIETDAPYVVPQRYKDKHITRNEPAFVAEVAHRLAEIKKVEVDEIARLTTQNAIELFGF